MTATAPVPASNLLLATPADGSKMYAAPTTPTSFEPTAIGSAIGAQSLPHENRQPVLAINYIIAAEGIYPSQC